MVLFATLSLLYWDQMSWKIIVAFSDIIQADTSDQAPNIPACVS